MFPSAVIGAVGGDSIIITDLFRLKLMILNNLIMEL